MRAILNGPDGKDCTWLAMNLFLRWSNSGKGRVITEFEHENLTLHKLLEFSCLVWVEEYEHKLERSLAQIEGNEDVDTGGEFDLRDNQEDLQEVQTNVGGSTKVTTAMEQAERDYKLVDRPETPSGSSWNTGRPL